MSKWKKRLLITLGVIAVLIATVFIVFHDNSDLAAIEREQKKSSIEAVNGELGIDHIGDDLKEFEDSVAVSQ